MCAKTAPRTQIATKMNCMNLSVVCFCFVFLDSWREMSTILPVKRDRRRGAHEENGAWRHTLFLQRPLQRVCAWGVWGKGYSNTHTNHPPKCHKMNNIRSYIIRFLRPFHSSLPVKVKS